MSPTPQPSPHDITRANECLFWEATEQQRAKSPDTPDNFARVWGAIAPVLTEAALPFRDPIDLTALFRPRVGFYLASTSLLAHTTNLKTLVDALAGVDAPIEPIVYVSQPKSPEFEQAFPNARHCLTTTPLGNWQMVRTQSIADRISAMVFVSNPMGMAFATAMAVAPRHVWWAHKWHGLELPYLDCYLDACHPYLEETTINGRQ